MVEEECALVRRPNLSLHGDYLREAATWQLCGPLSEDDKALWRDLEEAGGAGIVPNRERRGMGEARHRLLDLQVCDLIPAGFAKGRKRVVVIETHMDDAALSVGGAMWLQRHSCEFVMVTVVGRTNYTMCYALDREYFDANVVSAVRAAESGHCARLVGGRHVFLQGNEAPLRYRDAPWTLAWFRRHRGSVGAFVHESARSDEGQVWSRDIAAAIRRESPDEVWIPLGVGTHVDHELARAACLRLLVAEAGLFSNKTVMFYEDMPYAERFADHGNQVVQAITSAGAFTVEERLDITEAMADKVRLMSVYRSQFELDRFASRVANHAKSLSGKEDRYCERFHRLQTPPSVSVDATACSAHKAAVENLCRSVQPWLRRHRTAARIRLYLLSPAGRFGENMQDLLAVFPRAQFVVWAAAHCIGGTDTLSDPRVIVRSFGTQQGVPWLHALPIVTGTAPAVVLTGEDPAQVPTALRAASGRGPALSARYLHHFVEATKQCVGART
jgi:LmbE family N-acetylglucosaminyl deacetylase